MLYINLGYSLLLIIFFSIYIREDSIKLIFYATFYLNYLIPDNC